MSDQVIYERVVIKGTFTTESPAHFGATYLFTETAFNHTKKEDGNQQAQVQPCCKDVKNKPYIPSATVRGLLSHWLQEQIINTPNLHTDFIRLFGEARGENEARAGLLRVDDAQIGTDTESATQVFSRIKVNPILATAEDHKLFSLEAVPAGTTFEWRCEADRIQARDIEILLGLLNNFDGSELSSLGKGGSQYWGRVRWQLETVQVLTTEGLKSWLSEDGEKELKFFFDSDQQFNPRKFSHSERLRFPFHIKPQGPMLVNQLTVKPEPKTKEPAQVFMQDEQGYMIIPASTQRGLIRGHCRKILLTMTSKGDIPTTDQQDDVDKLLDEAFGSTGQKSRVWVKEARSTQPATLHKQMFNAIDRFTGGVADGKLFYVHAGWADQLTGELSLDPDWWEENQWFQGLMLFLLRDAMEGDLRLGWGISKGYGALKVELPNDVLGESAATEWPDLLAKVPALFGDSVVSDVVQALTDKLTQPSIKQKNKQGG